MQQPFPPRRERLRVFRLANFFQGFVLAGIAFALYHIQFERPIALIELDDQAVVLGLVARGGETQLAVSERSKDGVASELVFRGVSKGTVRSRITSPNMGGRHSMIHRDGDYLAVIGRFNDADRHLSQVRVMRTSDATVVWKRDCDFLSRFALPNGSAHLLALADDSKSTLTLFDYVSGKERWSVSTNGASISQLRFSPLDNYLVSRTGCWKCSDGTPAFDSHGKAEVSFSPSESHLLSFCLPPNLLELWQIDPLKKLAEVPDKNTVVFADQAMVNSKGVVLIPHIDAQHLFSIKQWKLSNVAPDSPSGAVIHERRCRYLTGNFAEFYWEARPTRLYSPLRAMMKWLPPDWFTYNAIKQVVNLETEQVVWSRCEHASIRSDIYLSPDGRYLAEHAPSKHRGVAISGCQVFPKWPVVFACFLLPFVLRNVCARFLRRKGIE